MNTVIRVNLKGLGLWVPEPGEKTVLGAFLSALTSALQSSEKPLSDKKQRLAAELKMSQSFEPEMNKQTTTRVSYELEKTILDRDGRKMGLPWAPRRLSHDAG